MNNVLYCLFGGGIACFPSKHMVCRPQTYGLFDGNTWCILGEQIVYLG